MSYETMLVEPGDLGCFLFLRLWELAIVVFSSLISLEIIVL